MRKDHEVKLSLPADDATTKPQQILICGDASKSFTVIHCYFQRIRELILTRQHRSRRGLIVRSPEIEVSGVGQ